MSNRKTELERYLNKTSEGEFLYELEHSYELSPILSKNILESAKSCLFQSKSLQSGQIEYSCLGLYEKSGKQIIDMKKQKVVLTLKDELNDLATLGKEGIAVCRQNRIQRLTEEALEQNGILSQEDLSSLLGVSVRTIKRDIRIIKNRDTLVITRGTYHNIGRGQTHKTKIINLYLDGFTYTEIKHKTHHSFGAIKRYLESFGKVLMCLEYGLTSKPEIRSVTSLSEYLIGQYLKILNEVKDNKLKLQNLNMLKQQLSYRYGSKKTIVSDGLRVEVMTGGLR